MDELEKKEKFYSFFQAVANNYWQTIVFIIIIVMLLLLLKYAQNKLDFPNSKMILNWFAMIVIFNLFITYSILMMYKQVKNQKGYIGIKGVQGPVGEQGISEYCDQCATEIKTVQPLYAEPKIKQPILPEVINTEPIGLDDEEENEKPDEDEFTFGGDETGKTEN